MIYQNAFGYKSAGFSDFTFWFAKQEAIENKEKIKWQDFNITVPKLDVVRQGIITFFSGLGEEIFKNLQVNVDEELDEGSLTIEKGSEILKLDQLSDGEKMLLMVVADIARRLSIANPSLENPLEGKGIVLIDEIELHLHPGWQRNVLPALMATFPNIQFIVTTHSPQVLGAIDKESILILEDFKVVENTPHTKGRDSNSILFELFGVEKRDKAAQAHLDKLYDLIENDDKVEAMKLLEEIKKNVGEQDIEVTRANTYIDLMDEIEEEGE